MARLAPLAKDAAPELAEDFAFFERTLGFIPNSLLTMAHRPALTRGLIALSKGVYDPKGEVDLGLKRLVGHVASMAAGCLYCRAHTATSAMRANDLRHMHLPRPWYWHPRAMTFPPC